jgi:hypothetical protein
MMKPVRNVSRRSFLIAVAGASVAGASACATRVTEDQQWDPLDNAAPRDRGRVRPGSDARRGASNCSDGDAGPHADPDNRGRHCVRR